MFDAESLPAAGSLKLDQICDSDNSSMGPSVLNSVHRRGWAWACESIKFTFYSRILFLLGD